MLTLSFHIYHKVKQLMSSNMQVLRCHLEPLQALRVTQSTLLALTLAGRQKQTTGTRVQKLRFKCHSVSWGSKGLDKALSQPVREICLQHLSPCGSSRSIWPLSLPGSFHFLPRGCTGISPKTEPSADEETHGQAKIPEASVLRQVFFFLFVWDKSF